MRMGKTRAIAAALALTLFATPASFALADDAETQELETQLEDLQKRAEEQQRKTDKLDERIGTVSRAHPQYLYARAGQLYRRAFRREGFLGFPDAHGSFQARHRQRL